jgi:hypothetical protein
MKIKRKRLIKNVRSFIKNFAEMGKKKESRIFCSSREKRKFLNVGFINETWL